jgi:hypothetical protein
MGKICRILRKCAYALHLTQKIDKNGLHNYFMSGKHCENTQITNCQSSRTSGHLAHSASPSNVHRLRFWMPYAIHDFLQGCRQKYSQKSLKHIRKRQIPPWPWSTLFPGRIWPCVACIDYMCKIIYYLNPIHSLQ